MPDVFRSFEIDKAARAAVFSRDQGQFCAGADLNTVCGRWKKRPRQGPSGLQKEPAAMVVFKSLIWANEAGCSYRNNILNVRQAKD
jgi:enoyl-CoA hydratase/carnithine racemase